MASRRFVFRLQPVLDQREREEEAAQLRVAAIERERLGLEQTLRQIQSELLAARAFLRTRLGGDVAVASDLPVPSGMTGVRMLASESLNLTVRAQQTAIALAGVLKRLEAARSELLKATAARKAVQLLKDRALEEHRRALAKKEAAELDEMTVMRHGRALGALAASVEGSDRP